MLASCESSEHRAGIVTAWFMFIVEEGISPSYDAEFNLNCDEPDPGLQHPWVWLQCVKIQHC